MYPTERLYEEVAFVAYYFHWAHAEILALPHWERRRWCEEISRINEEMNDDGRSELSVDPRVDDVPVIDMEEAASMFDDG